jgi:uncharacterized protein
VRRARLPLLLAALFTSAAPALAQPDLVGDWQGAVDVGVELRLVLRVTAEGDSLGATLDSPDQGAFGIPTAGVRVDGDSVTIPVPVIGAQYVAAVRGDTLDGVWSQGGYTFPLVLARAEGGVAPPRRPQEPQPPFPYATEAVRIAAPDGVSLAGTVTVPQGEGPFPAVVLVSGSGPQDRDETLLGHKPFLVLADYLTRHGVLVLRYDDRGVGESTGDFSEAALDDFASDARAAVEWLAARSDVRALGVVGHSEGGLVAPMVTGTSDVVDFVVLLAGPAVPGAEILAEQARLIGATSGVSEAGAEAWSDAYARVLALVAAVPLGEPVPPETEAEAGAILREAARALPEADRAVLGVVEARLNQTLDALFSTIETPWFRHFLAYDPQPALRALDVPALALYGAKDLQVPPAQNAGPMRTALDASASPRHAVVVLDGLNHLFQTATTGGIQEYARIEETMSPAVLAAVADWVRSLE